MSNMLIQERAHLATALHKKNVNNLHAKLGHPSEVITHATIKLMHMEVTSTFKLCEDCALRKDKKGRVCKKAVAHSKIMGGWLFFNISSPSTPTFEGKRIGYLS